MTRPAKKQGFRPITVDGIAYRWRVDGNRTSDIEVQLDAATSARGQRLCVNVTGRIESPITALLVSKIIIEAIAGGWRPADSGNDFLMNAADGMGTGLSKNAENPRGISTRVFG